MTNADPEGTDERARIGVEKVLRPRGRASRSETPRPMRQRGFGMGFPSPIDYWESGGARELPYSGVLAEPRLQTDFCEFPNSKASQNVSCRDVCRNWRLVRRSLLIKNIAFVRLEGRSPIALPSGSALIWEMWITSGFQKAMLGGLGDEVPLAVVKGNFISLYSDACLNEK